MIVFAHDKLGYKYLEFLKKKYLEQIEYLVLLNKKSKIFLRNKSVFKNKILIYSNKNKTKLFKKLNFSTSKQAILVWWPKIIKNDLFIRSKIVLNTHPSLLPFYRGKDPNFWSILGNGPYGVSINRINKKIDSGDIVFQKKFKIDYDVDAKQLYNKSLKVLLNLLKSKTTEILKLKLKFKKQKFYKKKINYRYQMLKKSHIHLNRKVKIIDFINLLRAKNFPPHDGVIFEKNNQKYSININIKKI